MKSVFICTGNMEMNLNIDLIFRILSCFVLHIHIIMLINRQFEMKFVSDISL